MKLRFLMVAAALLLAACSGEESASEKSAAMPGSDADEHGCIGSAGYQWCEATRQCERPWELAEKEGFDNTAEAFVAHCGAVKED